jgi:hypothetical protein
MSEPLTIGERYRKATNSGNLKIEARRFGDADVLIAAGWCDGLAITLYRLAGEVDQVARDVQRAKTKTDALLVLGKLKTLTRARAALVRHALKSAPRWGLALTPNIIGIVTGKVLAAWLDPNCPRCGGVGTIGGYDGKIKTVCRRCKGTGQNRDSLGESEAERYFAKRLLAEMDSKLEQADLRMRAHFRG